jgi:hypothetical protein
MFLTSVEVFAPNPTSQLVSPMLYMVTGMGGLIPGVFYFDALERLDLANQNGSIIGMGQSEWIINLSRPVRMVQSFVWANQDG